MKKLSRILLFSLISLLMVIILPNEVKAINKDYEDKVADIVSVEKEDNKINLYLFHRDSCPHCREELEWLETIKEEYKDTVNIYTFEIENNKDNMALLKKVYEIDSNIKHTVPLTIVGSDYINGFSDNTKDTIEKSLKKYLSDEGLSEEEESTMDIPWLGKVNVKNGSIVLYGVILGFIDGFNPCAMWILLFLINMLMGMENKFRKWMYGITFLFVSGLIYFLSMLLINFVLSGLIGNNIVRMVIGVVAGIAGGLNLYKYIKTRKEKTGCTVVDDKKRKKIITRIKKFISEKSFFIALAGVSILAISVNLIELACSSAFPATFASILAINNVHGFARILYLLLYTLMYMIDDIIVFVISMITLEATGITNKYSKIIHLIGGIIMLIMGILLIFKPEWIMLNFG